MLRNIVDAFSPSPRSQSPIAERTASSQINADTPFTKFVLSRLNEDSAKMFAVSFAEHVRNDPDEQIVLLDEVLNWLGYARLDNAVKLLKREFDASEIVFRLGITPST